MPKISAVIPVFNGCSRYLAEAIQSVLGQTFKDVELILVDDASTDQSHAIIPNHPKITYYRRDANGGPAAARNDGARLAQGECLAFLDQDDLWEPTFLEDTVRTIDAGDATAVVHTDRYIVNAGNDIIKYVRTIERTDAISCCLTGGHSLDTSGSLFRKRHFDEVNGYNETMTIGEDADLGIRLSANHRFQHIPTPLYRHRVYPHNVSRTIPSERALAARQYFLETYAPSCQHDPHLRQALHRDWADFYSDVGKHHLSRHQKSKAREALRHSLRYDPWSRRTIMRYLRSCIPSLRTPRL